MSFLSILVTIAALFIAPGLGSASTSTDSSVGSSVPSGAVHAAMRLDCTHMTAEAKAYADARGYCSASNTTISPNGVVYGNCGDSWIYIFDVTLGDVDIDYGFDSSLGTVVYRNLGIGFAGTANSGGWPDNGWMFSSSYYSSRQNIYVGYGEAYASLGGTVTLVWGGQCDLLNPSDATWVS